MKQTLSDTELRCGKQLYEKNEAYNYPEVLFGQISRSQPRSQTKLSDHAKLRRQRLKFGDAEVAGIGGKGPEWRKLHTKKFHDSNGISLS